MPDFTAHRHPVLAVACPDCRVGAGIWCRRPSGHKASEFHLTRRAAADRAFVDQHGADASIEHEAGSWMVDPSGRKRHRTRSGTTDQPWVRVRYNTPGTRLWWSTVGEWVDVAQRLDRRRYSSARNRALAAHGGALPRDVILAEQDLEVIESAISLLKYGPRDLARPQRGSRAGHPTTPVLMDLMNRRRDLLGEPDQMLTGDNWRAVFEE